MCLNIRNKRAIASPSSLSGQMKRSAKHDAKKKVQKIIQDIKFVLDNHETLKKQYGIDILQDEEISRYFTGNGNITQNKPGPQNQIDDPDLL